MSLFPSLLSLNANGSNKSQPQVVTVTGYERGSQSPPSSATSSLVAPTTASCTSSLLHQGSSASRRSSTVDDSGRFCSLPQSDGTPEILLSLCYFENQARLVVGVQKASGLGQSKIALTNGNDTHQQQQQEAPHKPPPDSFVRISAHSQDGAEVGKHKSEVVKASSEPMYSNAQAVFQIGRSELEMSSVQVMLFTFQGLLRRKTLLGQICVGEERCSSQDAQTHWQEMIQGMGTTVDKWHHLEPAGNKK